VAVTASRILDEKGRKVFTVEDSAPLQNVIDMLAKHHVGVLVVTSGEQVAGIISERDVVGALSGNAAAAIGRTAADVMIRSLETCTPDESEASLMERMNARGVRHLPVLAGGKLVGIVSMRDVVKLRIEKIDKMMRAIRHDAELLK
jgi:CBS domain-containing protein